MKIALFTPFGSSSRESGIIYLLANYLHDIYPEIMQLRCNGLFSLCDRDAERNWKRPLQACFACGGEQARLAAWSRVKSTCLSRYLLPRDVDETRRWILSVEEHDLTTARFREVNLFPFCRSSFRSRFGSETPDILNKSHCQVLRRLLLSAARHMLAVDRFHRKYAPDVVFAPGGEDFISALFLSRSNVQGVRPYVLTWDLHSRSTTVANPRTSAVYSCSLLIDKVTEMRSDPSTWPRELLSMIGEILSFLELSDTQLALPMAR